MAKISKKKKKKKLSKKARAVKVATATRKPKPKEKPSIWLPVQQIQRDIWFNMIFVCIATGILVGLKIWNPLGF
jgi:hypothetical protein